MAGCCKDFQPASMRVSKRFGWLSLSVGIFHTFVPSCLITIIEKRGTHAFFWAGATLVVGSNDLMHSGPDFPERITKLGITALSTVPSLLSVLEGDLPTVKLLIVGGEACSRDVVARWAPGRRFFNTYGPTEATVLYFIVGPRLQQFLARLAVPEHSSKPHLLQHLLPPSSYPTTRS
jgi:non-ribosomal peptide synthetase component F